MSDAWTISDDGTIESRTRGRIGTIKHCEGRALEMIRRAPEMYDALNRIAEGCSFPADDVQRAIRDTARAVLAKVEG